MNKLPDHQYLTPGKFYRAVNSAIWCCFKFDTGANPHNKATCVRVSDGRVESFYADGRYDGAGTREHCLTKLVQVYET